MTIEEQLGELVLANRILAREGVVDGYGHVSLRHPDHPDRFLLARSRSAELVEAADIMEFRLDGTSTGTDDRHPYIERFIHGSVYAARPDVAAVVHSHATEVLPFAVSSVPLRPVYHTAGVIGADIGVWDIRDRFGDTNMLVTNCTQGDDLAARLGASAVVLMRGHGFTAAAASLVEVVRIAVYLRVNARVQMDALKLGHVRYLSDGEIERIKDIRPDAPELQRAWSYWATRAGCAEMLDEMDHIAGES